MCTAGGMREKKVLFDQIYLGNKTKLFESPACDYSSVSAATFLLPLLFVIAAVELLLV